MNIRGGQGRSDADTEQDGEVCGWLVIMALLLILASTACAPARIAEHVVNPSRAGVR